jgi:putative transposase
MGLGGLDHGGRILVERRAMGSDWAAVAQEPARGARRTDDRRVISGVVHVLKTGCRRQDCPAVYEPSTTLYNRFRRRTMRGIWRRLFDALARAGLGDGRAIDSTTAKAHRSAAGGKGAGDWPFARRPHHEIHAIVDARGRPIAVEVTPGHLGDVRARQP